ncbi:MAG TPA: hypothetical protein VH117_06475 [Edaphobacter sp.]|nr:hypothetical protein [Edaphobacter sp.]
MLIPAFRPVTLSILLVSSAAAIPQTPGYANNPYTATQKVSLVQKLVDGTTISRVNTTTEARDSQGRTMQQTSGGEMQGQSITHTIVMDPVAHTQTIWMSQGKQATRIHMPDLHGVVQQSGPIAVGLVSGSMGVGSNASFSQMIQTGGSAAAPGMTGTVTVPGTVHPARQVEKLCSRNIAGVYAEGTKITITYPAGSFGNDRPIITTHETWMSPDLKLLMLSINDDPRSGTHTTEVTNLDRAEPSPALFQVPEGYTIKDQYPGSNPSSIPSSIPSSNPGSN